MQAKRSLEKQATRLLKRAKRNKPASVPSVWAMNNRPKLLGKDNKAEDHIEQCLRSAGMLFTREFPVRCNGRDYFIDFAVETTFGMVAIEVDGAQHMTPKGQAADRIRDKAIIKSGEAVVVIRMSWAHALKMDRSIVSLILWACGWPGTVVLRY